MEKQRDQRLAEIRSQYKPINNEEFKEHNKKYQDVLMMKKAELRRKRALNCDSAEPR